MERRFEVFNMASIVDESARRRGDKVALYHYDTTAEVTYKEVGQNVNRVGNALRSLGVEMENRVAILMDDRPEYIYIGLGVLKIGAIATPMNPLLSNADMKLLMQDSRAKVIFVDASYLTRVREIRGTLRHLKHVVVYGEEIGKGAETEEIPYSSLVSKASTELKTEETSPFDVAFFMYTSGTTGLPRAIMHHHRRIFTTAEHPFKQEYGVREGDIQFHTSKMYFTTNWDAVAICFTEGVPMVLLSARPLARIVLEVIAKYRPTFISGSPTIYARMIEAAKEEPHLADLSSLRYIWSSGEILSKRVFQEFKEVFGKEIYNNWGAQELADAPFGWREGDSVPIDKVGSAGKLHPYAEAKIVDDQGNEVPNGVLGQVMLKVGDRLLGYWHQPEEATFRIFGEWFRPADYFMRDEDGYYWCLGRADDMVKVGGGRLIFPPEVEAALAEEVSVRECAVVDIQDKYGLTQLKAFVVLKEGYSPSDELASQLKDFVKGKLAAYKRPSQIEFVKEIPKTGTGKIQRVKLREFG